MDIDRPGIPTFGIALCSLLLAISLGSPGCDETGPGTDPGSDADADTDADTDTDADGDTDEPLPVVRLLPLGDSVTLGYGSNNEGPGSEGGYRLRLAQLLAEAEVDFDFVGSQVNGPAALTDKDHEGHNGLTVPEVAELGIPAVEEYEPHVVLLMAGTNDQITFVPPSQSPAEAAADMDALIYDIDESIPGVQIVLAQIIPLTYNDSGVTEYNGLLPAIVDEAVSSGINVRLVDMYAIGSENLSFDGIHPTDAGYDLIADIWYPALLEAISEL